ncbi:hypothetical protein [Botrimarina sp.]|uniref:hypothetical protein n=1 Tax=Botrimarina sp. TaxID=2795802 RepID=UPI0032EB7E85
MSATATKKAAATKAPPSTTAQALADELKAAALVQDVITRIERRVDRLDRGHVSLTLQERSLLRREAPEAVASDGELRRTLAKARAIREARERGVSRQAIAAAEAALEKARAAASDTAATLEDLDVGDDTAPALERQIARLTSKYAELVGDVRSCEAELGRARRDYESLRGKAPQPLQRAVGDRRGEIKAGPAGDAFREARAALRAVEHAVRAYDAGAARTRGIDHAYWRRYAAKHLPESILPASRHTTTRRVDEAALADHMEKQRAKLPELRRAMADAKAALAAAIIEAEKPLDVWAAAGRIEFPAAG